ncbi:PREDICTED: defensin-like protein 19-like [Fragaria vesca subsp. vesca]
MASATASFRPTISLHLVFLLIASMALPIAEGGCRLVQKPSLTWSGNCGNTRHCDKQCRTWESAKHGACHVKGSGHACFCYFCRK